MNYGGPYKLTGVEIHASRVTNEFDSLLWLITAILGAVTRMDQSLLQSMIVLPIVVTGIGMLVIAAVMTVIFCYNFLLLWKLRYGFRKEAKQYMCPAHLDAMEGDAQENELTG